MMMGYHAFCGGGSMMFWNPLFWILVVIAVVLLIVWLVKQRTAVQSRGEESALDILKKRYAKGEITKEDFEQMKKDIS
jgi:putative membrane protein